MGVVRLGVCVAGVYATFLLWAIAQERLSVPFPSKHYPIKLQPTSRDGSHRGDKFPSPLFLNFAQALASSLSAVAYLVYSAWRDGSIRTRSLGSILGWSQISASVRDARPIPAVKSTPMLLAGDKMPERLEVRGSRRRSESTLKADSAAKDDPTAVSTKTDNLALKPKTPWRKTLLVLLLQVAVFQTTAGPIGFLALNHISYPTMVLGKSCKLIPVLLLNVLLYRRKFSAHKYVVVALVTLGISLFTLLGDKKKSGGSDSSWGLVLLLFNLLVDGLTNSTQDQIFSTYPAFTGQQMMFTMAFLTQLILLPILSLPLPTHPASLLHYLPFPLSMDLRPGVHTAPIVLAPPAMLDSIRFLISHPAAIQPLVAYAVLGGLGQLFIFETIQHFGSLTLVMVTVTRKLFTMLLSVVVFEHKLSSPQWLGVAVVFSGIGVEAAVKQRDVMRKARRDPK